MSADKLRALVFTACANSIENGYALSPDNQVEAREILDQDADVAELVERLYSRLWDDPVVEAAAVEELAAYVQEYKSGDAV